MRWTNYLLAFTIVHAGTIKDTATADAAQKAKAAAKNTTKLHAKGKWVNCQTIKNPKPGPVLLRKRADGWFDCWVPARK